MFFKGLVTVLAVDLLMVVLAVPLIVRKVRRNVVYGFRTCATLADDYVWYETNAFFGRGLLVSSLVSAGAVLVLSGVNGVSQSFFFAATIAAMVLPPLVATVLTLRFSRSLTPGGPTSKTTVNVPR